MIYNHSCILLYFVCSYQLTVQLALIGLMEYLLHLTKLYPDMMYVHQDSGLINVAYFKFNIDDAKGRGASGEYNDINTNTNTFKVSFIFFIFCPKVNWMVTDPFHSG